MIDSRGVVVALQTIAAAAQRGLVFGAEAVTFHVMRQLLPSGAARYDTYKQHSWIPGHVYYRRVFGLSLPVALLMSPGPTLSLTAFCCLSVLGVDLRGPHAYTIIT